MTKVFPLTLYCRSHYYNNYYNKGTQTFTYLEELRRYAFDRDLGRPVDAACADGIGRPTSSTPFVAVIFGVGGRSPADLESADAAAAAAEAAADFDDVEAAYWAAGGSGRGRDSSQKVWETKASCWSGIPPRTSAVSYLYKEMFARQCSKRGGK